MAEVTWRYFPPLRLYWFHCEIDGEVVMDMVLERQGLLDLRDLIDDALAKGPVLDEEYQRELERANRERVEPLSVEQLEPGQEPI